MVNSMIKKESNKFSPEEMVANLQWFASYKEECKKTTNIQSRALKKGKQTTASSKLIKGRIQAVENRIQQVNNISTAYVESVKRGKEVHVTKIVAKLAQREVKVAETSQTL